MQVPDDFTARTPDFRLQFPFTVQVLTPGEFTTTRREVLIFEFDNKEVNLHVTFVADVLAATVLPDDTTGETAEQSTTEKTHAHTSFLTLTHRPFVGPAPMGPI